MNQMVYFHLPPWATGQTDDGYGQQNEILPDFWAEKLDLTEGQASIPAAINQEK
jgi:hypothetical protein